MDINDIGLIGKAADDTGVVLLQDELFDGNDNGDESSLLEFLELKKNNNNTVTIKRWSTLMFRMMFIDTLEGAAYRHPR